MNNNNCEETTIGLSAKSLIKAGFGLKKLFYALNVLYKEKLCYFYIGVIGVMKVRWF